MYNYKTSRWDGLFITTILTTGMMLTSAAFWVRF